MNKEKNHDIVYVNESEIGAEMWTTIFTAWLNFPTAVMKLKK